MKTPTATALCSLAFFLNLSHTKGATYTNAGPDTLWSTDANWDGGVVPVSGSANLTINYNNPADISTQQDLADPFVLQSIVLGSGAGDLSLSSLGNSIQFANLGAAPTILHNTSSGGLYFNNFPVELADSLSIAVTQGGYTSFNSEVSGVGGLSISGGGSLSLSGGTTNTYTGLTTVSNGSSISLGKTNATAIVGDLHILGGSLGLSGSGDNQIADTSLVTIEATTSNSSSFTLSRNETIGDLVLTPVDGSSVNINFYYAFRTLTLHGDVSVTANLTGSGTANMGSTTGTAVDLGGATRTFDVGDGLGSTDLYVGSPIINGGMLKTGAGRMRLTGANTYAGGTTVSNGILVGNTTSLQGNIINNSQVLFESSTGTYSGDMSGTGSLRLENGNSTSLTLDGNNSFTGGIQIISFNFTLAGNTTSLPGDITISDSFSRVRFDQATDDSFSGSISGNGILEKDLAGILTLNAVNTHSGGTFITEGTLRQGIAGALPANRNVTIGSGALLDLNGLDASIRTLQGAGDVELGAGNLTVSPNTVSAFDGSINGAGSLTKSGSTLTLNNAHTYTGGTILTGGTLAIGASERLEDSSAFSISGGIFSMGAFSETVGAVSMTSGSITGSGTLTGTSFDLDAGTVNVNLAGTTGLTKNGFSSLTLNGTNSYTGVTTINSGTLVGSVAALPGDVVVEGAVSFNQAIDATYAGALSGSGSLQKTGNAILTLGSANTYAGSTTISSGTLRQGIAGAIPTGTGMTLSSSTTLDLNDFDLTVSSLNGSGVVALGAGNLVIENSAFSNSYSGQITGTGSLTKQGTNTLTLGSTSSYTGGTFITAGTLSLSGSERLADTGAVEIDGGTLSVNSTETLGAMTLVSGSISGFGQLYGTSYDVRSGSIDTSLRGTAALGKTTPGTVTLSRSNYYTGGTTVSDGILVGGSFDSLQGDIVNDAVVRFASFHNYSANMSGTGSVEVTGGASFTGTNTYSGGTTVTNSSLTASTSSLPGDVVLYNGSLGFDQASNGTFAGDINGDGSVSKSNSGELTLSYANSFSGGFSLQQGGLAIGDDAALGTGPVAFADGTLVRADGGPRMVANSVQIGGSVTFTGSEDLTFTNVLPITFFTGQLISSNTAATTLNGTFDGFAGSIVSVTAGTLAIGNPASFIGFRTAGSLQVANGATLVLQSAGFADVSPLTTLSGGTLAATNGVSFGPSENLIGHGAVNAKIGAQVGSVISATTGNLTLGDVNSLAGFFSEGELYTNQYVVTLSDANEARLGSLTLLGAGGNSGTLVADNGLTLNFGGNIAGYGTVNTPDNAATPLINNGHISGDSSMEPVTLTGYIKGVGTLDNVVITGTDAPGFSPATVNRGSVAYDGVLEIELGGTSIGSFDRLQHILGAGIANLGGTLDVSLLNGFTPAFGDTFEFITASSIQGTFADVVLPQLAGPLAWHLDYGSNSVSLAASLGGDFDFDGDVDGHDFLVWQRNPTVGSLHVWQSNYGLVAPLTANSSAIPEPSSLFLAAVASSLLCLRRRTNF